MLSRDRALHRGEAVGTERLEPVRRFEVLTRGWFAIHPVAGMAAVEGGGRVARRRDVDRVAAGRAHGELAARPSRFASEPAQPIAQLRARVRSLHHLLDEV